MRLSGCLLLVLAGCSNILGLSSPQLGQDAAGDAIDALIDAMPGDFTFQVTTPIPRIPSGGFEFLDVSVTASSPVAPIELTVPQPPQGVTVPPVTIAPGTTTAELRLEGAAELVVGSTIVLHVVASNGAFQHATDVSTLVTLIPGSIDTSFGDMGGVVTSALGGTTEALCARVAVGSDGTLTLFGGNINAGKLFGVVARVASTGFFTGFGVIQDDQNDAAPAIFTSSALTADGGAVAGGTGGDSRTGSNGAAWLARFSSAGTPVVPFGDSNGLDFLEPLVQVDAVAVTPSGAIVAVVNDNNINLSITRQTGSGGPDVTFGGGSAVSLGVIGVNTPLALDNAGSSYYAAGNTGSTASTGPPVVVHVGNTGVLDASFGSASAAVFAGLGEAVVGNVSAIVVVSDGSLYVAGTNNNNTNTAFVVHLTPAGTLDTSFGTGGVARAGSGNVTFISGIAQQSDGKLVVTAGTAASPSTPEAIRFTPDGTLDPTYGTNGIAAIPISSVLAMAMLPDDDLIACGIGSGNLAAVTRVVP